MNELWTRPRTVAWHGRASVSAGWSTEGRLPARRDPRRPAAAGVFEPAFGLVLRPEIAALSMSGSSFLVAVNALLLRRLRLPGPGDKGGVTIPGGSGRARPATPTRAEGPSPDGLWPLPPGGIRWHCDWKRCEEVTMNAGDIIVVVTAIVALAGLGWFFFGPRKARTAELAGGVQRAAVTVRGGYSPEVIRVRQGVPVELTFDRQESGDCTSRVVFPDFRVSAALPAWQRTTVRQDPDARWSAGRQAAQRSPGNRGTRPERCSHPTP